LNPPEPDSIATPDPAPPSSPTAGVIGLGIIGSRAASCLRRAGYHVWVWNRTLRPEPNFLATPAEVADSARHIQIFVSNGEALLSVVRAMAPVLTPAHIILNHATVSPRDTLEAAEIVRDRQAAFLDAPFTGSRDAAGAGQLVYYVGGDSAVLETVRPLLEASSKQILPVGEIGQASVLKIASNLLAASQVGALAEALALLDRHGVELHKLALALEKNAARSGVIDMKLPAMLTGDFEPRFSLKHMFKDLQLALSMARDKDVEIPTASAFAGIAMAALQRGWGESDFSVVSRFYGYPGARHTIPSEPAQTLAPQPDSTSLVPSPPRKKSLANLWGLLGEKK
jgi:3-hydroxyisobutyrate dehydrogenase-like beta-hydroxyacid dehydrogenase